MNVNLSDSFASILGFIVSVFKAVIGWLDGIIIIGDSTSLLDLNIAFTVFSIIFVAVFSVVRAGAVNSGDTVAASRASAERSRAAEAQYKERRDEGRRYNDERYKERRDEGRRYNEELYERRRGGSK